MQPGLGLEHVVDRDEAVVDRPVAVENHLDDAERLVERVRQRVEGGAV